ncbi:MAG: sialate O-acetylesterase [Bacteroidales bacterium]|nr:sialate O-acetylesterase [Bacteroidales bacterium]
MAGTIDRVLLLAALFAVSAAMVQDERTRYFPRSQEYVEVMPPREKVWLFVLAGQSNMAGRGQVEPCDTVPHPRIFSVTPDKRWVVAREPLQLYQPALTGLGPGMAFARALVEELDEEIYIGLIPCAVGGSSVGNWLSDSLYKGVRLKSNFTDKLLWAKEYGTVKGILWHQGEADATAEKIAFYKSDLTLLFDYFREVTGDDNLPVIAGELGIFPGVEENRQEYLFLNDILLEISRDDPYMALVRSFGLKAKADNVHFDGPSQRIMGRRYAAAWLSLMRNMNY